jgi:hypothetical protein
MVLYDTGCDAIRSVPLMLVASPGSEWGSTVKGGSAAIESEYPALQAAQKQDSFASNNAVLFIMRSQSRYGKWSMYSLFDKIRHVPYRMITGSFR